MPDEAPAVPPAGRKFPCPACGARLDFDPAARGLKCPYCGFERKIGRGDAAEVAERDYLDYLEREGAKGAVLPGRSSETRCPGCGAAVLLEDHVATDRCPFCATHLENRPDAAKAMIPPESLLPFTVDLREARDAFTTWLSALWFAPTELVRIATLGELAGVYLPYWTYDAATRTFYDGERGDRYTVQESYTDTDANGNTVTRHRSITRTAWSHTSGEVNHFFDDVLVCASASLPDDLIDAQDRWPLRKLEPFRPEYLSGFRTERYSVELKEGFRRMKAIIAPEITRLVERDIGGDEQRIHDQRTRYAGVTFKPLLLPLWVAAYRYREKTYRILVNGRTGQVVGGRPWSAWKIARLAALIALGLIAVLLLLSRVK